MSRSTLAMVASRSNATGAACTTAAATRVMVRRCSSRPRAYPAHALAHRRGCADAGSVSPIRRGRLGVRPPRRVGRLSSLGGQHAEREWEAKVRMAQAESTQDPARASRGPRWREHVRSKPGLSHAYRVAVFVAGLVCIAGGLALSVLPGPLTIPPVLLGLWLWSTEFRFAIGSSTASRRRALGVGARQAASGQLRADDARRPRRRRGGVLGGRALRSR